MTVNEKIKKLREEKGLTLDKLAELAGFTKRYLSKIERSSKIPSFATVQSIAEALQVDLAELLDSHLDSESQPNVLVRRNGATVYAEKTLSAQLGRQ